jgi:NTE family protein
MPDVATHTKNSSNTALESTNEVCEPVQYLPTDTDRKLVEGTGLCLSGGGYRAMLFHVGVLWRLNEIGWLPKLNRISSVSGGSITAGVLAMNWTKLNFQNGTATNFEEMIAKPIWNLASRTIDVSSVLTGAMWFGSIGDKVADSYRKHLFGDTTLQDIVDEVPGESPRFVFNATNVQSGVLWRFMKPYMADYRVGIVKNPKIDLAVAVAASSAFPPVLSPVELDLDPADFTPGSGTDLQDDSYRTQIVLTDGGVYDNLGLETVWKKYKTILVSDAGGGFTPDADPHRDWVRHSVRVLLTIDNQVRSLRKRQLIESFLRQIRKGTYLTISADANQDYNVAKPLNCPYKRTSKLAGVDTRLKKLDQLTQERLINWGYAVSDLGLRQYVDSAIVPAIGFPFPASAV